MSFKQFVQQRIQYYVSHFQAKAVLLQTNGEPLSEINLSFDHLSDEYMLKMEELQKSQVQMEHSTMKLQDLSESFIKIIDSDLDSFWDSLTNSYKLSFNIEGQNLTDKTLLKLGDLYESDQCSFTRLNFSGNHKISQIGAAKLGKSLQQKSCFVKLIMHNLTVGKHGANRIIELIPTCGLYNIDLGLIGNESLKYLSSILKNPHKLQNISFGEDSSDPWTDGKIQFQKTIRRDENSRQILSINLYLDQPIKHYELISELNILCKKNRMFKVDERQNQFKSASLNPKHPHYYDPDNHGLNAFKFSVKSYLTNVFGSDLDQALYFLQKERRNSLREDAIFQITKEPISKTILEDICTSDGSIVVLAKYLLSKKKQTKQKADS